MMPNANAFVGLRIPKSKKKAWKEMADQDGRSLSKWIARTIDAVVDGMPAQEGPKVKA